MEKQKVYHPGIDILRIIAILAVLGIHTTTRVLEASSYNLVHMPVTFFLNQSFRFAVPLFFIISGFVLELNYPFHANYFTYLKKRFGKVLIPYLFWSFLYYFFLYTNHSTSFLSALTTGNASYQLYFIPTLLIFYLLFPLLHKYYRVISQTVVLILLGLFQTTLLFYDYTFHPISLFYPVSIALLNFYPFILGAFASHHKEKLLAYITKKKYIIILLTCIFAVYVTFEGLANYTSTHNYLAFYSQWRPSILLYTILIGMTLFYFSSKKLFHAKGTRLLSNLSFFVFFVHIMVLEIVWRIFGKKVFLATNHMFLQDVWFSIAFFLLIAGISFFLAFFIKKMPFLNRVTG